MYFYCVFIVSASVLVCCFFFFFNDTATTEIYTLSLHDALPISTHGTLTSGYGWRWGRMHRGIDVAGPVGTPIVSAAPGVVERAGWNSGGYGNLVEVRHADGSMTRYAHNSRIIVRAGQQVAQGQHIADMGSTGYSTGPHLHFEVHVPSRGTVNPMAMLPGR